MGFGLDVAAFLRRLKPTADHYVKIPKGAR